MPSDTVASITLERIDPVLNNSSCALHYSFIVLHMLFLGIDVFMGVEPASSSRWRVVGSQ